MFLPIGDSPNSRHTPWATYTLIAINVLVYVVLLPQSRIAADRGDPAFREYIEQIAAERAAPPRAVRELARSLSEYDLTVFKHGFRPSEPAIADVFAGMFLHGGLWHLLGNMLFLWIYGDNVEARLGSVVFVIAYLATGAIGALGDGLIRAGSGIPAVGASGAISGVLGFYFIWFPHNRVRLLVFLFPLFMNVIEVPARIVLALYLIVENLLPLLITPASTGVSYGAHIGGFACGLLLALLLRPVLRGRRSDA